MLRDVSNQEDVENVPPAGGEVDPEKLKIKYDYYKRVSNMLVLHLRQEEDRNAANDDWTGIKQSDLANWYVSGSTGNIFCAGSWK